MILNVNNNSTNRIFNDINEGECFAYNGDYYIMAYDEGRECEYFGVNLKNGQVRDFESCDRVQLLTAEVNFKELQ